MPQADGRRKRGCYFAHNNVLYVAKDRHISPIPVVPVTYTGRTRHPYRAYRGRQR